LSDKYPIRYWKCKEFENIEEFSKSRIEIVFKRFSIHDNRLPLFIRILKNFKQLKEIILYLTEKIG